MTKQIFKEAIRCFDVGSYNGDPGKYLLIFVYKYIYVKAMFLEGVLNYGHTF